MKNAKAKAFFLAFQALFSNDDCDEGNNDAQDKNNNADQAQDADKFSVHGWFFKRIGCGLLGFHPSLIFSQIQALLSMIAGLFFH